MFALIKAEHIGKVAQAARDDVEITHEDEDMKSDIFDDLTLLRRVSSKMEVEPYNRISALDKAV